MCYIPGATELAVVSTVMSATQAAVGHMAAAEAASQTNANYKANAESALDAYQGDIEASNLDAMAAQEASTQRRVQTSSAALAARGASRAAAGERGIGGLTAAALQRDLGFQEGQQIAAIDRNADLDTQRYRLNVSGSFGRAQSRINSAPRSNGPSLLALGANLGASAVNGYTMRSQLRANAAAGAG